MKTCSYCGAQYPDDTPECPIDHTPISADLAASVPDSIPATDSQTPAFEFATLSPEQMREDLVTLVTCRTLVAADLVVCRLRAADIAAYIPDEFLMQAVAWNFNTFGYVRVQVAPQDYDAARALLSESGTDAS